MSILQTSVMSQVGQLVQLGQDAFKAARQAVKGLGQDSKYFASTKKGEAGGGRWRTAAYVEDRNQDARDDRVRPARGE